MIDFMVIAAPRSGTTWMANLLTTDTTLCLHDPLYLCEFDRLDELPVADGKSLGISCSGSLIYTEKLNAHPARKLILHRNQSEIEASLSRLGLTSGRTDFDSLLYKLDGLHCPWTDIFDAGRMRPIYEFLLQKPFDGERFEQLRHMNIQPEFATIPYDAGAVAVFTDSLRNL